MALARLLRIAARAACSVSPSGSPLQTKAQIEAHAVLLLQRQLAAPGVALTQGAARGGRQGRLLGPRRRAAYAAVV
jgi:hypothetical protein